MLIQQLVVLVAERRQLLLRRLQAAERLQDVLCNTATQAQSGCALQHSNTGSVRMCSATQQHRLSQDVLCNTATQAQSGCALQHSNTGSVRMCSATQQHRLSQDVLCNTATQTQSGCALQHSNTGSVRMCSATQQHKLSQDVLCNTATQAQSGCALQHSNTSLALSLGRCPGYVGHGAADVDFSGLLLLEYVIQPTSLQYNLCI